MKKFLLVFFAISLLFSTCIYAEDVVTNTTVVEPVATTVPTSNMDMVTLIKSLSSVQTGIFYNINDSKFQFVNTVTIYQYPATDGWLNINVGYANQNTAVASVTANVIQLNKWGVTLPVLKDVVGSVGFAGAVKRLTASNEWACGPVAQLKVKIDF